MRLFSQFTNKQCSFLEFSVAHYILLEHLTSVWKVVGSIPIWNSEFSSEFFSPHISFYLIFLSTYINTFQTKLNIKNLEPFFSVVLFVW